MANKETASQQTPASVSLSSRTGVKENKLVFLALLEAYIDCKSPSNQILLGGLEGSRQALK